MFENKPDCLSTSNSENVHVEVFYACWLWYCWQMISSYWMERDNSHMRGSSKHLWKMLMKKKIYVWIWKLFCIKRNVCFLSILHELSEICLCNWLSCKKKKWSRILPKVKIYSLKKEFHLTTLSTNKIPYIFHITSLQCLPFSIHEEHTGT